MGLSDLTLQLLGFRVLALLIIAGLHGGVLAAAAVLLGDKGPRYDGRLTVAPTAHVDLLGAIGLVLFGLGWTKPIDVDGRALRIGPVGVIVVVVAGFLGLLGLAALLDALVAPVLTTMSHTAGLTTAAFLRAASSLSIWYALFNLIPVPPLAAGMLLPAFGIRVPRQAQTVLRIVLIGVVAAGIVRQFLAPAHAVLASVVLGG